MKSVATLMLFFVSMNCFGSESFKIEAAAGSVVGISDLGRINKTMNEACLFSSERAELDATKQCTIAGGQRGTEVERVLSVQTGRLAADSCSVTVSIVCVL